MRRALAIGVATVTIAGLDEGIRAAVIAPITATEHGVATFTGLRPGRYAIKTEFSGFAPRIDPDVRVRAGENKQTLALALQEARGHDHRRARQAGSRRRPAEHVRVRPDARTGRRVVRR